MKTALAVFVLTGVAFAAQEPTPAQDTANREADRHLIFLAENRPIFVRLRVMTQGRPFEASWIESVRTIYACLDLNGDGTLTTKEANPTLLNALVRLATGLAEPVIEDLDIHPKNGTISYDELAEGLRPVLGPFMLQVGRQPNGRTDALFEQLDRDKDGELTRPELAAIAGSLRPLDLDDDEMISAEEIETFNTSAFASLGEESTERRARFPSLPPVVELIAGGSSLRPSRLLLKKYDKGKGDVPGRPDNKLSRAEFAIDSEAFTHADKNSDDELDTDEVRGLVDGSPVDLTLEVNFTTEASGQTRARVESRGSKPEKAQVLRLADGDVEFAIGAVRLDLHVEEGNNTLGEVHRLVQQRFKAADLNKNGYLEGKELATINGPQSPLAGLSELIDRDRDKKIYLKELIDFADLQTEAARSRLVVTTADQGRAIFGILDLDRDRRLGSREVMRTVDRVMSWDRDSDGRIAPDEIPYHFQVNIDRGSLSGLIGVGSVSAGTRPTSTTRTAGPDWFQKMDRNHDGDVSRREFLGPREEFDRLDRDKDSLINAEEATTSTKSKP